MGSSSASSSSRPTRELRPPARVKFSLSALQLVLFKNVFQHPAVDCLHLEKRKTYFYRPAPNSNSDEPSWDGVGPWPTTRATFDRDHAAVPSRSSRRGGSVDEHQRGRSSRGGIIPGAGHQPAGPLSDVLRTAAGGGGATSSAAAGAAASTTSSRMAAPAAGRVLPRRPKSMGTLRSRQDTPTRGTTLRNRAMVPVAVERNGGNNAAATERERGGTVEPQPERGVVPDTQHHPVVVSEKKTKQEEASLPDAKPEAGTPADHDHAGALLRDVKSTSTTTIIGSELSSLPSSSQGDRLTTTGGDRTSIPSGRGVPDLLHLPGVKSKVHYTKQKRDEQITHDNSSSSRPSTPDLLASTDSTTVPGTASSSASSRASSTGEEDDETGKGLSQISSPRFAKPRSKSLPTKFGHLLAGDWCFRDCGPPENAGNHMTTHPSCTAKASLKHSNPDEFAGPAGEVQFARLAQRCAKECFLALPPNALEGTYRYVEAMYQGLREEDSKSGLQERDLYRVEKANSDFQDAKVFATAVVGLAKTHITRKFGELVDYRNKSRSGLTCPARTGGSGQLHDQQEHDKNTLRGSLDLRAQDFRLLQICTSPALRPRQYIHSARRTDFVERQIGGGSYGEVRVAGVDKKANNLIPSRGDLPPAHYGAAAPVGELDSRAVKSWRLYSDHDSDVQNVREIALLQTVLPPHPNLVTYLGFRLGPDSDRSGASHAHTLLGCADQDLRKWLLTGDELQWWHQQRADVRWQLALGFGSDLLHGVAHLFKHGTVHRDLKPANVLVCGRVHMRQDTIASLGRTTNSTRLMRSGGAPRAEPSPHLNRPRLRLADFGMAQVGRHAYDEQVYSPHGNDEGGSFALSGTSGAAALAASATSSFQSRSSSSSTVMTPASSVLTSTTTTQQQYPELYLEPHRHGEMLVQTPAYRAPEVNNDCARRLPYEIIGTGINNCLTGAAACKTGYSRSRSGAAAAGTSVRIGGTTAAAASSTAQSSRSSSMIDDQNTIAWTHKIDVWSVGLIMLDILKALFPPERELIPSPVLGPTENGKSLRGTDLYSERVYHELRLPLELKAKAYQVDRAGAPLPGQYSFKVGAAQQQMQMEMRTQQELQVRDPSSTASDVVMGTSSVSTTTAAHQQQQQQERSQQLNALHFPEFTVVSQMVNSHASTNADQHPRAARGPLVPPSHRRTQPISSLQTFSSQVEEQRKADAERKKRAIEQHEFATQLDNAAAEMMAGLHSYKQLYFKDVVQRVQTSLQNLPGLRTPEHVQLQAELKRMIVALRKMLNPIPEERGHVLEVLQDWTEIGATKKTSSGSSPSSSVVSGQEQVHVEGASTIPPDSGRAAATTTGSSSNSAVVDQYRPDPSFRPTFPRMFQYLQDDMKEFLPPLSTFVILQLYADQVRESVRVTDEKNAALNSQRGNSRALERESGIRDWRLIMIDKPPWYPGCRAGEDEDDVTARSAADHPHVGPGPVVNCDVVAANKASFSSSDSSGRSSSRLPRVVDGSVTGLSSTSSTSAILRGRAYGRREQEPSSRGEDDDRSAMMSVSAASATVENDTEQLQQVQQQPRGWVRRGGSSTTTAAAAPDGKTATTGSGHEADRAGPASSRIAATNTRALRGWGPVAPAVPPTSQPRPAAVEQERHHGGLVVGSTCCPPAASTAVNTATTCTTAAAPARNLRLQFQDPPERQCFLRNCGAAIWNLIFPNRTGGNVGTRTPGGSTRGGAGGAPAGARQQGTNLVPSQHAVTGTNNATTNFIPQVFGHPLPPPRDRTPPLQQPAFTRL
ncbi:unnamed protein product [Amoebophrya sp. A120]|nr:unnamed protein product [Amoebophrya sp. A120]|eukprot:GSA120T00018265001.1